MNGFNKEPDHVQEKYLAKAQEHLLRSGRVWCEANHDPVMYITAVYLYNMDTLSSEKLTYPYYVVHSHDTGWRFECTTVKAAFQQFKEGCKRSERVAMFYWKDKRTCERTHASEGYPFEKDFGART